MNRLVNSNARNRRDPNLHLHKMQTRTAVERSNSEAEVPVWFEAIPSGHDLAGVAG